MPLQIAREQSRARTGMVWALGWLVRRPQTDDGRWEVSLYPDR